MNMTAYRDRYVWLDEQLSNSTGLSLGERVLLLCEKGIMSRNVHDMARSLREIEELIKRDT